MSKYEINSRLGEQIRRQRKARKLNQTDLARRVGLSRTSITNIESGRQALTVHQLFDFAEALGVDAGALLPDASSAPKADVNQASMTPQLLNWISSLKKTAR